MPTRGVGNWDDWGMSNGVLVEMAPGEHEVSIEYLLSGDTGVPVIFDIVATSAKVTSAAALVEYWA